MTTDSALVVDELSIVFRRRRGQPLVAVDQVGFAIDKGSTFGLVGESGSGKTTIGRAVLGLVRPSSGTITVSGHTVRAHAMRAQVEQASLVQAVFQDPVSSLNPARRILDALCEPLRIHAGLTRHAAVDAAEQFGNKVNLQPDQLRRLPHQLSGGQCQRAAIARALAPEPLLVVCDEPVTALDVSIQAQVVNLLADLQAQTGTGFLFISHDISVVRQLSHRVGVMHAGRLVELGDADAVCASPMHPYTRALLDAIPVPDPVIQRRRRQARRVGDDQSEELPPSTGCLYRLRCPWATEQCAIERPRLREIGDGHSVACHHASNNVVDAQWRAGDGPPQSPRTAR